MPSRQPHAHHAAACVADLRGSLLCFISTLIDKQPMYTNLVSVAFCISKFNALTHEAAARHVRKEGQEGEERKRWRRV